ncbi:MAG: hypothetical protein QOE42_1671 [Chloroflexota bacterium]|jgi:hypothetical protein|nr:hypothetical protein [Chloroflexota bacterium]
MRTRRPIFLAIVLTISSLGLGSGVSARTLVDPTSLTPPLLPIRICYQLGPEVQCDTSGDVTYENRETDELPCGLIYQSGHEITNSTRFYRDGLLVRRAVQERITGTWSLSPTGAGPTVAWAVDDSWDDAFTVPGDINSFVRIVRGSSLRVPVLGSTMHLSGMFWDDGSGTYRGLFTNDDAAALALCALLVG